MSNISFSTTDSEEEEFVDNYFMEAMLLHQTIQAESSNAQQTTRAYIYRNRIGADARLVADYFAQDPTYNEIIFRRRFRMSKSLFMRIVDGVSQVSPYFQQRHNCAGTLGFSTIQKVTVVFRMLAYGTHPDALDESFRMSGRTARESLHEFCRCVLLIYKKKYLRSPNAHDVEQLQAHHANVHSFPGMLGSLDCMHWKWEGCPNYLKGQYTGAKKCPTVVLEAVASQDLWFWHGYFGSPGSLNAINILGMSPIFNKLLTGTAPDSSFVLGGQAFRFGYYLTDGIYPEYSVLVKTLSHPTERRRVRFKRAQEKARKDIERAFGTLKKRFHVIYKASIFCEVETMQEIMFTCMILHNMILEDENHAICDYDENANNPNAQPFEIGSPEYDQRFRTLHSATIHTQLSRALIDLVGLNANLDLNLPPTAEEELAGQYSDHDQF